MSFCLVVSTFCDEWKMEHDTILSCLYFWAAPQNCRGACLYILWWMKDENKLIFCLFDSWGWLPVAPELDVNRDNLEVSWSKQSCLEIWENSHLPPNNQQRRYFYQAFCWVFWSEILVKKIKFQSWVFVCQKYIKINGETLCDGGAQLCSGNNRVYRQNIGNYPMGGRESKLTWNP